MSQINYTALDLLLSTPPSYIKNLKTVSEEVLNAQPSELWTFSKKLSSYIQIEDKNITRCMLSLRFVKDTLMVGSHAFFIVICANILVYIRKICQLCPHKDNQTRALFLLQQKLGRKEFKQEQISIGKSIILLSEQMLRWYAKRFERQPFAPHHGFRSAFAMHYGKFNTKQKGEEGSFTFFRKEDSEVCKRNYLKRYENLKEELIPMKNYVQSLVKNIILHHNQQQSNLILIALLRTGDSHIIEAVHKELREKIENKIQGHPPLPLLSVALELSKCGEIEFNTLVKVSVIPIIFTYLFNSYEDNDPSESSKKSIGSEKKELLQLLSAWNQIALRYKIDNEIFHASLMKAKYWIEAQVQFCPTVADDILKEINMDKNNSIEEKYGQRLKRILEKLKNSEYGDQSNEEMVNSLIANYSQFPESQYSIQSERKENKEAGMLRKKQSQIVNFPNQDSKSNLSKNDRFEKKSKQEYKKSILLNFHDSHEDVLKSEASSHNQAKGSIDDIRSKLTNKMKMKKSVGSLPQQNITFKSNEKRSSNIQPYQQQIKKREAGFEIKEKKLKKVKSYEDIKFVIDLKKARREQKKSSMKERIAIKVQPTVRKPPFAFKTENQQSMQSQDYSLSITNSVEIENEVNGQSSYSSFSDVLNAHSPNKSVRVIENDLVKGYAINPYSNREKELSKKIQQLKKNNMDYSNKIKQKDERIVQIKEKMEKEKQKFTAYQTTLGKAYENINQNIDSLMLSSNNHDRPPDYKLQEQLKPLKKFYSDFFTPVPKKIVKQILYSKCLLVKNSDLEIGYVNNHEKQSMVLYYTFHKGFDSVHLSLEGEGESGFVFEENFDVRLRNVAAGKNIKIEIKIFDYDETANPNSKMKFIILKNQLQNKAKDECEEEAIEYKVQLPYCLYGNFIKFTKAIPSNYRPSYASYWESACDELLKNRKEYIEMLFKGGFWSQQNIYRFDCSLKGVVYKMAVLLDHRNFCIQGEGKGNSHLASVIGCLLIK